MAGASLVLAKDSFWKPACHLPVPAVQPPPQGLCLRSRAADAEPGSGFLHSVQRARVANRLIPVWSTEARGLAPLPKEKGGHPIDKVLIRTSDDIVRLRKCLNIITLSSAEAEGQFS